MKGIKDYDDLDICRLIEIGIILKEKQEYNELIKKHKDCDLETFGNLCIKIYQKWGSCNPKDLKCEENFGYITEFLNNETEIVSNIIKEWIKE